MRDARRCHLCSGENAGYRAGIHMKEYQEKVLLLMIGGRCGSFRGISGRRRHRGTWLGL